jgi:hypothetical protein
MDLGATYLSTNRLEQPNAADVKAVQVRIAECFNQTFLTKCHPSLTYNPPRQKVVTTFVSDNLEELLEADADTKTKKAKHSKGSTSAASSSAKGGT